ncbi:Metastasis suppressor protein 1 [Cichlidogyrus casuarinus]|uniref:Metastasis suppressor protein 1 n=1 Tax=Cichlidogyrus casuarinus TaxID=1844966 RepID=A0ABD2Q1X8_9PLAT
MSDSFAAPLSLRVEEWRRSAVQMEREYYKESRRFKAEIQRSSLEADKWSKRVRRKDILNNAGLSLPSSVLNVLENGLHSVTGGKRSLKEDALVPDPTNFAQSDLAQKIRSYNEWEQGQLKKCLLEQRRRFQEFMTCFKPLLDMQLDMFSEMGQFQFAVQDIYSCTEPAEALNYELLAAIVNHTPSNTSPVEPDTPVYDGCGEDLFFPPTPAPPSAASFFNTKFDSLSLSSSHSNSSHKVCSPPSIVASSKVQAL